MALDEGIEAGDVVDVDIADIASDQRHAVYFRCSRKQIVNRMVGIHRTHATPFFRYLFSHGKKATPILLPQGVQRLFQTSGVLLVARAVTSANLLNAFTNFADRHDTEKQIGILNLFKPVENTNIGGALVQLRDNIRIEQVTHQSLSRLGRSGPGSRVRSSPSSSRERKASLNPFLGGRIRVCSSSSILSRSASTGLPVSLERAARTPCCSGVSSMCPVSIANLLFPPV
nr:KrmE [uncultured bacterium]